MVIVTPVLELNCSELEVVVAGKGLHCAGRGPSSCLVCATSYPSQTPPGGLDRTTIQIGQAAPLQLSSVLPSALAGLLLHICSL